mgnify:CR=1 FL=1
MTQPSDSIRNPDLIWREDGQPVSREFDDPYFSVDNGLEESRYIYLQNSGLPQRWHNWHGPFCIVETGFGTGLNFFMTWQAFEREASTDCWLHFTSIEKYPLSPDQLRQAMILWPEMANYTRLLLEQYPDVIPGFHHIEWPEHRVRLTLVIGDVSDVMNDLSGPVHAWFLDGFAPARNPDMWSDSLFRNMRRISLRHPELRGQTTVATFTSSGMAKRGLQGAGFRTARLTGYGRKWEMLGGRFEQITGPEPDYRSLTKPWLLAAPADPRRRIAIIGAGMAGATTAAALAEQGFDVDVYDAKGIASGASGNPQGGLYIKLAASENATHSEFYLAAFQASLRLMRRLAPDCQEPLWSDCGVLQQATTEAEAKRQQRFLEVSQYPPGLIQSLDAEAASHISGTRQTCGGLYFPAAGWVSPATLCRQLLSHPRITVRIVGVDQLRWQSDDRQWQLQLSNGETAVYPQVVVATAVDTPQLLPDSYLPIKSIRGQITLLDAQSVPPINTVLCGEAYTAPALDGQVVVGATYHQNDSSTEVRTTDQQKNIEHLLEFGPDFYDGRSDFKVIGGRTSFRCTTPDYLPMVGSVPNRSEFIQKFGILASNARKIPATDAPVLPGLWLNIGHGSRGLASTPLCAAILAADITGCARPISERVIEALWPGRFLLRDIIRKKLSE